MKKTIHACLFCLITFSSFAQIQLDSSFTISGSVDMYYRGNLNGSNDPSASKDFIGNTIAPATSFANSPGFSLGMFNLITAYEGRKVGFVADMVFGPRGAEAVFGSPAPLNIVNQLYGYWNVTDNVKLTLGNFNTFLGYEVISPAANFNYSTSYMFSYGPFSHSGLKMDVDLGGGFSGMLGVFNPTDATDFNPSNDFVAGAQLGYTNDLGAAWLNLLLSDGFYQVDLTTGWQVTDKAYLGLNATTAQDNFSGAAIYAQYATSDALTLGLRAEYFADTGLELIGTDENVIDLTASANYKIGNLTIIPEVRIDLYSADVIVTDVVNDEVSNSLASFVLAAVYTF